jgi:cytochrome b561
MQRSDPVSRYPLAVIVLHWSVALAVIALVILGWWMQTIPKVPVGPRADAYNLHKSIGLTVLLLMALRLAWRASHRPPELPPLPRWQAWAAHAVHVSLYVLMFLAAFSGYLGSAVSGYPVKYFGWVLPAWAGANTALKDACSVVHVVASWALAAAIGVHILATAHHQWVLRDGLLARMWPARASAGAEQIRPT